MSLLPSVFCSDVWDKAAEVDAEEKEAQKWVQKENRKEQMSTHLPHSIRRPEKSMPSSQTREPALTCILCGYVVEWLPTGWEGLKDDSIAGKPMAV